MQSHRYELTIKDLLRALVPPLLPLMAFAVLMHAGPRFLPAPSPALNTDGTILAHQAHAAQNGPDANWVLIGDSSCLMDVSARQLSEAISNSVLDLGTLSYLDLDAYHKLLRVYLQSHPPVGKKIVLLLHPEALRRNVPEAYYTRLLDSCLAG